MARGGINKALVLKAKQALQARGARPTIDAVRTELGNTGSKSTIHRYLQELANSPQAEPPVLSEELCTLLAPVADRLALEAEAKVAAEREAIARQQLEYTTQRRYSEAHIHDLQQSNATLTEQLSECRQSLEQMRERYQVSESERARVEQHLMDHQGLLEERANQLRSLEDKHQLAREALEHFRTASKEQREQEHQRHGAEVQQLQTELRNLRQVLLSKQDELATLNRDNERLLVETRTAVKRQTALEKELTVQRAALQTCRQEITEGVSVKSALAERLKHLGAERQRLEAHLEYQSHQLEVLQEQLIRLVVPTSDASTDPGASPPE